MAEPRTSSRRQLASREDAQTYDNRVHGHRQTGVPPDDRTLDPRLGISVRLERPRYNDGPLTFRPFPCLDYQKPAEVLRPGRKSPEPSSFTNWYVRIRAASYVGAPNCPQFTFLLHHPADEGAYKANPYRIFAQACRQAADTGHFTVTGKEWRGIWNPLTKGTGAGGGKGEAIPRPCYLYFTQAAVYANGDKIYAADGARSKPLGLGVKDDLTVVQCKGPAFEKVTEMLDRRLVEGEYEAADEERDPSAGFYWGDPVGYFSRKRRTVEGGLFFTIFNPKKTKIAKNTTWTGEEKDVQGYEGALSMTYKVGDRVYKPDLSAEDVDVLFNRLQFWFPSKTGEPGLLRFPSVEEQCVWVAQAFRTVPDLIVNAWSENDEYMTDDVKGILRARVTSVVPRADEREERDEDDDRPRRGRRDEGDEDRAPRRARRDEEEEDDDRAPRGGATVRRDPTASHGRDEEDDRAPRRAAREEEDEADRAPRRAAREEEEDEDRAPRRAAREEDEGDRAPRRARRDEEDEDDEDRAPRRARPAAEEERDEFAPRRGRRAEEDEERPARPARARSDEEEPDERPRRARRDEEDEEVRAEARAAKAHEDEEDDRPRRARRDDDEEGEAAPAGKAAGRSNGKAGAEEENYMGVDDKTEASMAAAQAHGRSAKRKTPAAEPPAAPPSSKGGTARRAAGKK